MKTNKRAISTFIAAIMCIMTLLPLTTIGVSADEPRLGVRTNSLDTTQIHAGGDYDMVLTVENTGTAAAKNVVVKLTGLSSSEVSLAGGSDTVTITEIAANSTGKATFTIKISDMAPDTMDKLQATLKCDGMGAEVAVKLPLKLYRDPITSTEPPVQVVTSPPDPEYPPIKLILDSYTTDPASLVAGDHFTFKFTIKNTSSYYVAQDVKAYITCGADMLPSGTSNIIKLYNIGTASSVSGSMEIDIDAKAKTQLSNITITLEYTDQNGAAMSATLPASIRITGATEDPTKADKVNIKDVTLSASEVKAGANFTMTAVVSNTGAVAATDLEFDITSGIASGSITPTTAVTTLKSAQLKEGGSYKAEFKLNADEKMETGVYPLTFTVKYKDAAKEAQTLSYTVYVRVIKDTAPEAKAPAISMIKAYAVKSNLKAGEDTVLKIELKNIGKGDAKNVKFKLGGLGASGVTLTEFTDLVSKTSLAAGASVTIEYSIRIDKKATGTLALTLDSSCIDQQDNTEIKDTFNIYIPVIAIEEEKPDSEKTPQPRLLLENFSLSSKSLMYGQTFTFGYSIKNLSQLVGIKDVRITIDGGTDIAPANGINTFVESTLGTGKSFSKSIALAISETIATGTHPIAVTVSYIDDLDRPYTEELKAYVKVTGKVDPEKEEEEEGKKSIPRVLLSTYSLDVTDVYAGKDFVFDFVLFNSSKLTDISNMKVTVSSADGIFTPVEGSNTFYTELVPIGGNSEYKIKMNAKGGAEQKSYPIVVSYDYEDEKGTSYHEEVSISIYVTQPTRFEITNFNYPPSTMMGQPMFLSMQYFNKGKIALNNLTIDVSGDFTLQDGQMYIGNFPASSSDFLEVNVVPNAAGSLTGAIIFSYEDAAGNLKTHEEPFTVEVMEMSGEVFDPGMNGEMPVPPMVEEEAKGFNWVLWGSIGGGGLLVVIIVIVIIVNVVKAKKKKEESEW